MHRVARVGLIAVLVAALVAVGLPFLGTATNATEPAAPAKPAVQRTGVPKLLDLGSKSCIPCKLMAPILDEMTTEFKDRLVVEFVDVNNRANMAVARKYGIQTIPTQIFLDAEGKELDRHVGFISRWGILDTFRTLGYAFATEALKPQFSRMEPAKSDDRPKDRVCQFCDGDINAKTAVVVKTDKGDVKLCSPHCWFIMYSCLTENKTGFDAKASVADWATGKLTPMTDATYLYDFGEKTGRPTVKAFADRAAAEAEKKTAGGSLIGYDVLKDKELATRCGFCDRAVYPEDAARVIAGGIHTWGCCSHCAMGVAARTRTSIEVHQPDRLTGEMVVVRTLGPYVVSVEPKTAVAWFGQRKKPDGSFASAGCFHQGFFTDLDNLKAWADQNPAEVGHMITIDQALADKMKLSPEQIAKACKMGECAPK